MNKPEDAITISTIVKIKRMVTLSSENISATADTGVIQYLLVQDVQQSSRSIRRQWKITYKTAGETTGPAVEEWSVLLPYNKNSGWVFNRYFGFLPQSQTTCWIRLG